MPIRHLAVAIPLALGACAAPETTETVQLQTSGGRYGSCPHAYPCQPGTPWSVVICDAVCSDNGGNGGYCEPYTWKEEEWCVLHPGTLDGGLVLCDQWGNPQWKTVCLPYVMP